MATENTEATPTQESPAMGDHGEGEPAAKKSVEAALTSSVTALEKQGSKSAVAAEPSGSKIAAAASSSTEQPAQETTEAHEDKGHEDKALDDKVSKRNSDRKKTLSTERRHSSIQEPLGSPSMNAAIDKARSSSTRRSSRMSDFKTTRSASRDMRNSKNNRSIASIKRGSMSLIRIKGPKYMNSYKLNPEKPFNPDKVQSILAEILEENIDKNFTYDPEHCPNKAKALSATIRARVKDEDYDRYKIVCLVTIGEKKSYDMFTILRFLWDAERDRYATYKHENMSVFAVATVFGIYYE